MSADNNKKQREGYPDRYPKLTALGIGDYNQGLACYLSLKEKAHLFSLDDSGLSADATSLLKPDRRKALEPTQLHKVGDGSLTNDESDESDESDEAGKVIQVISPAHLGILTIDDIVKAKQDSEKAQTALSSVPAASFPANAASLPADEAFDNSAYDDSIDKDDGEDDDELSDFDVVSENVEVDSKVNPSFPRMVVTNNVLFITWLSAKELGNHYTDEYFDACVSYYNDKRGSDSSIDYVVFGCQAMGMLGSHMGAGVYDVKSKHVDFIDPRHGTNSNFKGYKGWGTRLRELAMTFVSKPQASSQQPDNPQAAFSEDAYSVEASTSTQAKASSALIPVPVGTSTQPATTSPEKITCEVISVGSQPRADDIICGFETARSFYSALQVAENKSRDNSMVTKDDLITAIKEPTVSHQALYDWGVMGMKNAHWFGKDKTFWRLVRDIAAFTIKETYLDDSNANVPWWSQVFGIPVKLSASANQSSDTPLRYSVNWRRFAALSPLWLIGLPMTLVKQVVKIPEAIFKFLESALMTIQNKVSLSCTPGKEGRFFALLLATKIASGLMTGLYALSRAVTSPLKSYRAAKATDSHGFLNVPLKVLSVATSVTAYVLLGLVVGPLLLTKFASSGATQLGRFSLTEGVASIKGIFSSIGTFFTSGLKAGSASVANASTVGVTASLVSNAVVDRACMSSLTSDAGNRGSGGQSRDRSFSTNSTASIIGGLSAASSELDALDLRSTTASVASVAREDVLSENQSHGSNRSHMKRGVGLSGLVAVTGSTHNSSPIPTSSDGTNQNHLSATHGTISQRSSTTRSP